MTICHKKFLSPRKFPGRSLQTCSILTDGSCCCDRGQQTIEVGRVEEGGTAFNLLLFHTRCSLTGWVSGKSWWQGYQRDQSLPPPPYTCSVYIRVMTYAAAADGRKVMEGYILSIVTDQYSEGSCCWCEGRGTEGKRWGVEEDLMCSGSLRF